jgi:short subunit dehydrogenase-like uncharacterized protein
MIYGANGYTGGLIIEEAKRRGQSPILAGRNRSAILALGQKFNCETQVFSCENSAEIEKQLEGVSTVLHCAGPFSQTSAAMIEACVKAHTNYLDITGEVSVFEEIQQKSEMIQRAGIVAIPGVGFDVVPTDCLAAMLKSKLPSATHLALGLSVKSKVSPGTAKTMVENLGKAGLIRKDGKLVPDALGSNTRTITFRRKPVLSAAIPWGDVSTAYSSTAIPNIAVYIPAGKGMVEVMKLGKYLNPLLRSAILQRALKKFVDLSVKGSVHEKRLKGNAVVWGEVKDSHGKKLEMKLQTPEPYLLTAEAAVSAVERVGSGKVSPGVWTPSQAFGAEFVLQLSGVQSLP